MKCFICRNEHALQEHHLRMQAKGGSGGDTIFLCSNCHDLAHKQERLSRSTNPKTRKRNYFPPDLHDRGMQVVAAMLAGSSQYEFERDLFQDHALLQLTVNISPRQKTRLHGLKVANGFSNMDEFLESIIAKLTGVRAWKKDAPASKEPPK